MFRPHRLLILTPVLLALAGCPQAQNPTGLPYLGSPIPNASASPASTGLGSLVQEATAAEQELANNLNTPLTMAFPIRLGILFYNYTPALKPEDQQTVLNQMKTELAATGLVRSTAQIPSSLVRQGDSLETLRKLVSRFQVDTLLVISGENKFERAGAQNLGFFDQFSNKAAYESRTALTALGMNVVTGRFMLPFQAAGGSGPTVLNPDDSNFAAQAYDVKKDAETKALNRLKLDFITALQNVQSGTPAPVPTPTPSPSESPSATPTATPTPEPSESPSASPSASPAP